MPMAKIGLRELGLSAREAYYLAHHFRRFKARYGPPMADGGYLVPSEWVAQVMALRDGD